MLLSAYYVKASGNDVQGLSTLDKVVLDCQREQTESAINIVASKLEHVGDLGDPFSAIREGCFPRIARETKAPAVPEVVKEKMKKSQYNKRASA